MKQWSVAVLLTRRLKDGGVKLLVVPVFVRADDADAAIDRARDCATRSGWEIRGYSVVAATADGAIGVGVDWKVSAWVSML